jgi:hypothetical protein
VKSTPNLRHTLEELQTTMREEKLLNKSSEFAMACLVGRNCEVDVGQSRAKLPESGDCIVERQQGRWPRS